MKKFIALIAVMFLALALVGCGGGTEITDVSIPASENKVNSVKIGDTLQLTAKIEPAELSDAKLEWSSSDITIATVDQNGLVTGVKKGQVTIAATAENGKRGTKRISVTDSGDTPPPVYPDLGEYEITIAQAVAELGNFDPYLDTYTQSNKEARIRAWEEVSELFNCKFKVEAYPESAEWGPARWNYILNQARYGVADYDFYTVPDGKIPEFAEAGALLPVEDWYYLYGGKQMDNTFITSGSYDSHQYSIAEGNNNVYNVMYYNYNLWVELNKIDPNLKEPAELFMDGTWTYTAFKDYCIQAQEAMKAYKGAAGTAKDPTQEYFVMSGWDSYWWIGLSTTNGEPLADTELFKINMDTSAKTAAADTLKTLYNAGVIDKTNAVDGSEASWKGGKSLFTTGDMWFVRHSTRWTVDQWGDGTTKYAYVPWPMPDNQTLAEYKVALGGTATWVMPIGRDYSLNGPECTAENIYWAVQKMWQLTKQYHEESDDYNPTLEESKAVDRLTDSPKSAEALKYIRQLIKDGKGVYDPLSNNDNAVASLYSSGEGTITYAVRNYIRGTYATWGEAAAVCIPNLQEGLRKAFIS